MSMHIHYHFQKRCILFLYTAGATLEEGCFQCKFEPGPTPDSWHVELQTAGSTNQEAGQIEDDGTLTTKQEGIQTELSAYLSYTFDAVRIRPAIVDVQGKDQQKVVTFLASSNILLSSSTTKVLLNYKQPEVMSC